MLVTMAYQLVTSLTPGWRSDVCCYCELEFLPLEIMYLPPFGVTFNDYKSFMRLDVVIIAGWNSSFILLIALLDWYCVLIQQLGG